MDEANGRDIGEEDVRLAIADHLKRMGWNVVLVAEHGVESMDPNGYRHKYFMNFLGSKIKKPMEEKPSAKRLRGTDKGAGTGTQGRTGQDKGSHRDIPEN